LKDFYILSERSLYAVNELVNENNGYLKTPGDLNEGFFNSGLISCSALKNQNLTLQAFKRRCNHFPI